MTQSAAIALVFSLLGVAIGFYISCKDRRAEPVDHCIMALFGMLAGLATGTVIAAVCVFVTVLFNL